MKTESAPRERASRSGISAPLKLAVIQRDRKCAGCSKTSDLTVRLKPGATMATPAALEVRCTSCAVGNGAERRTTTAQASPLTRPTRARETVLAAWRTQRAMMEVFADMERKHGLSGFALERFAARTREFEKVDRELRVLNGITPGLTPESDREDQPKKWAK